MDWSHCFLQLLRLKSGVGVHQDGVKADSESHVRLHRPGHSCQIRQASTFVIGLINLRGVDERALQRVIIRPKLILPGL